MGLAGETGYEVVVERGSELHGVRVCGCCRVRLNGDKLFAVCDCFGGAKGAAIRLMERVSRGKGTLCLRLSLTWMQRFKAGFSALGTIAS